MAPFPGFSSLVSAFQLVKDAIDAKQDAISGAPGQVVGFDASGKPVPQTPSAFGGGGGGGDLASGGFTGILPIERGGTGNDQGYIQTGSKSGSAPGRCATVEGSSNIASGACAHAEGIQSEASRDYAHAEGQFSKASGTASHAEGYSKASGAYAHAEGQAEAVGEISHAENAGKANGEHSHAEGCGYAIGECSHAEGYFTYANNFASHAMGHHNKNLATGGSNLNQVGDAMAIGNGTLGGGTDVKSNCFRVTYAGEVYGLSAFHSTGADYAEYFEWADGNPNSEDRVGYFVTLDGDKVRVAQPGEYVLGVVSGQPCIIGNADEDWMGRWEHDVFGRFVREDVPSGGWRCKPNPDYDPGQPYIQRKDRPEWSAVGMLGVLAVRDDGQCQPGAFCRVAAGGAAAPAASEFALQGGQIVQNWRVLRRSGDHVILIVFR